MSAISRIGWRNLWRHKRRTLITASAMAFGLAFCMSMIAMVDGVYTDMFAMIVGDVTGHAQIHHPDYPKKRAMWETIPDADALLAELEALPEVEGTTQRLFGYGLLGFEDDSTGTQLIGIDPAREAPMTKLDTKLVDGRYLGDVAKHEALIGVDLADKLDVPVGGEVVVVTQAADGSTGNDLYTVVGIVETGQVAIDRAGLYLHLADAQELLVLPDQVHEITMVAADAEGIDALVAAVTGPAEARGLLPRSWAEVNPQMAQMMEMSDASSVILMFFIYAVAVLGILNTMLMSVFERTKELGVIRALGLRPFGLFKLVLWETAALTAVSCAIGIPLGLAGDAYLVLHGLDLSAAMSETTMMGVKYNPVLMGEFHIEKVLQVVIGLFVISFLAALWPAIRAARLKPVQAMRQE
jgi:ABC-type lipoprotein release transport system permease subunit